MKETSRAWTVPELGGLEVMHASFVRHQFAKHSHETFTVVLIDDGASRFWYRGAEHVIGAGMVALLNPDEAHTGSPITANGYSQRSLHLEPIVVVGCRSIRWRFRLEHDHTFAANCSVTAGSPPDLTIPGDPQSIQNPLRHDLLGTHGHWTTDHDLIGLGKSINFSIGISWQLFKNAQRVHST